MYIHDATEQAYKNGYSAGYKAGRRSVNAVEVVHGKWEIRVDPYRMLYHNYHCSVCGGWKHNLAFEHENMNYCPNCGAKMDGE